MNTLGGVAGFASAAWVQHEGLPMYGMCTRPRAYKWRCVKGWPGVRDEGRGRGWGPIMVSTPP